MNNTSRNNECTGQTGRESSPRAAPRDPQAPAVSAGRVAWVRTIGDSEAEGHLREQFAAATRRAGRVYNIVRSMSLNPGVLDGAMQLYLAIMHGPSPLTRAQRELLATVTSACNSCHY